MANKLTNGWQHEIEVQKALMQRQERWHDILRRGHAKLSECMEADFGTHNPNGLDIDHWDDDHVINFKYEKEQSGFFGFVDWNKPEDVCLKPFISKMIHSPYYPGKGIASNIFSHEVLHSRQGFERKLGIYNSDGNFLTGVHVETEKQQKDVKRIEQNTLRFSFNKYDVKTYLAKDCEIQARLNEIITCAYHDWGRMPGNEIELMAGLHNTGLLLHPDIIHDLKESMKGKQALQDFSCSLSTLSAVKIPVTLINRANKFAMACEEPSERWKIKYNNLYGNMLELYGDKEGIGRVISNLNGYRDQMQFLAAVHNHKKNINAEDIARMSFSIPKYYEIQTVSALYNNDETKNLGNLLFEALKERGRLPQHYLDFIEKKNADRSCPEPS